MSKPIRLTQEKKQELISRSQLGERLTEIGWLPVLPEDLGEDIIVNLYTPTGQAMGANFYVQIKSITNLDKRHRGNSLVYRFPVKDMKHWSEFELPVVLMVWDIKRREGRWELVCDAIEKLDNERPKWRFRKTKTLVHLPWANTTDNVGLIKLKQSIGQQLFPLISKDKPLQVHLGLEFPDTECYEPNCLEVQGRNKRRVADIENGLRP